MKIRAIAFTV